MQDPAPSIIGASDSMLNLSAEIGGEKSCGQSGLAVNDATAQALEGQGDEGTGTRLRTETPLDRAGQPDNLSGTTEADAGVHVGRKADTASGAAGPDRLNTPANNEEGSEVTEVLEVETGSGEVGVHGPAAQDLSALAHGTKSGVQEHTSAASQSPSRPAAGRTQGPTIMQLRWPRRLGSVFRLSVFYTTKLQGCLRRYAPRSRYVAQSHGIINLVQYCIRRALVGIFALISLNHTLPSHLIIRSHLT